MLGHSRWAWARPATGCAILGVVVWWVGPATFLAPLHRVDAGALAAGAAIAAVTTVCAAWRWRLVSRGLGSDLPLGTGIAAYYRAVFLNLVLPGGVLGDVHRAVRRGREVGDIGHAVRAVVWERSAGQVVQVVLTVLVLLALPSPVRAVMPPIALAVAAAIGVTVVATVLARGQRMPGWCPAPLARLARALVRDVSAGLLSRRAWPGIALTSIVIVLGHATTFVIAAKTAGSSASVLELLPLALLVLLAMAVPLNVAGWGPREGAAAWVFAAAGLGAAQGVGTAVVYALLALVGALPGAVALLASRRRSPHPGGEPAVATAAMLPEPRPVAVRGGAGG